ncbi:MAG: hypothetical protein SFU86_19775 [Pirellulaceae bacterium]|nr:hypothetical protein [Pirellulaceae bacterium]
MSRFRFSIGAFLLVITLVALAMSAVVSQSRIGGTAATTVFLALICLAVAGAILRPLPARAFWLGFAIFGWAYWFAEFDAGGGQGGGTSIRWLGPVPTASRSPVLLTHDLVAWLEANLTPNRKIGARVMAQWRGGSYYSGTIQEVNGNDYLVKWDDGSAPQWTPSAQIATSSPAILPATHSLCGGLFALLGGILVATLFGYVETERLQNSSARRASPD